MQRGLSAWSKSGLFSEGLLGAKLTILLRCQGLLVLLWNKKYFGFLFLFCFEAGPHYVSSMVLNLEQFSCLSLFGAEIIGSCQQLCLLRWATLGEAVVYLWGFHGSHKERDSFLFLDRKI